MSIIKDRKFETSAIMERFSAAKVGDVITFKELSKITGMAVTSTTSALSSARRIVLNENHFVFESVRGVGLRRIGDEEISIDSSDRDVRRSRRHAKRSLKKLACVENFAGMNNHAQLAHTIKASFFGAVFWMASKNRLNDIARAAAGRSSELPVKETLQAFLKSGDRA